MHHDKDDAPYTTGACGSTVVLEKTMSEASEQGPVRVKCERLAVWKHALIGHRLCTSLEHTKLGRSMLPHINPELLEEWLNCRWIVILRRKLSQPVVMVYLLAAE
jgi:hypothetical protein